MTVLYFKIETAILNPLIVHAQLLTEKMAHKNQI